MRRGCGLLFVQCCNRLNTSADPEDVSIHPFIQESIAVDVPDAAHVSTQPSISDVLRMVHLRLAADSWRKESTRTSATSRVELWTPQKPGNGWIRNKGQREILHLDICLVFYRQSCSTTWSTSGLPVMTRGCLVGYIAGAS